MSTDDALSIAEVSARTGLTRRTYPSERERR